MKILIDARLYGLENAGLGRYVMNLITQLSEIDHDNEYILVLRKKYFDKLSLPKNFKKTLADYRHYSVEEQLRLPSLIKSYAPDVVHFPHFNVPVLYHGPFVVTIHDMLMHKNTGRNASTLPLAHYIGKRLGYKTVFRKAVYGAREIIVPSDVIKKELQLFYKLKGDNVTTIYEGLSELKAGKNSKILEKYGLKRPYFVYAGNAYPHKNLESAICAIINLNQHSRVEFAIISARGNFTEKLGRFVAKCNGTDYIKLLGYVSDSDLGQLYQNSLGFLYPSLSEGFGLQGLEAISSGTVVAASDIPVFREIYQDNVLYFDPTSVDLMTQALDGVVKMSDKERLKLITKGQAFIKKYSWREMATDTLKIYTSIK